jgi:hypothetical protein
MAKEVTSGVADVGTGRARTRPTAPVRRPGLRRPREPRHPVTAAGDRPSAAAAHPAANRVQARVEPDAFAFFAGNLPLVKAPPHHARDFISENAPIGLPWKSATAFSHCKFSSSLRRCNDPPKRIGTVLFHIAGLSK